MNAILSHVLSMEAVITPLDHFHAVAIPVMMEMGLTVQISMNVLLSHVLSMGAVITPLDRFHAAAIPVMMEMDSIVPISMNVRRERINVTLILLA